MSSGLRACLEIRGTATMPPDRWVAVVPSVFIDEVPNRSLFTSLAGHYLPWLDLQPLFPSRGVPADATQGTKKSYEEWGGAAYDASWLTYQEFVTAVEHMSDAIAELERRQGREASSLLRLHQGVSIDAIIAFLAVYHSHGFETRIVFWFTPV